MNDYHARRPMKPLGSRFNSGLWWYECFYLGWGEGFSSTFHITKYQSLPSCPGNRFILLDDSKYIALRIISLCVVLLGYGYIHADIMRIFGISK